MKRIMAMAFAVLAGVVLAAPPTISNFGFSQNKDTTEVTVTFTLEGDAILTMNVKTNGVSIGWRNFRSGVTGAKLNQCNAAGNYELKWRPVETWPGDRLPVGELEIEMKAWSPNDPPDYLDADLTQWNSVKYYIDEDDLPYPVTDNIYKKQHLLMKRIHAANKTWLMGSPSSESGRDGNEVRHPVTLSADYYIGVYEFTQGQWLTVPDGSAISAFAAMESTVPVKGDYYPVSSVRIPTLRVSSASSDWPAKGRELNGGLVLAKIGQKTGLRFDLPTEAQWEYAARGGTSTAYSNGKDSVTDDELSTFAVWSGNAPKNASGSKVFAEVGTKAPNGYGLYDMAGNVSELVVDWFQSNLGSAYQHDPVGGTTQTDATGALIARGGPYSRGKTLAEEKTTQRSAWRGYRYAWKYNWNAAAQAFIGFRLVSPVGAAWPAMTFADGTVLQDVATRIVTLKYDLDAASIVTIEAYVDGEKIPDEAMRSVSGAVNRLVPAGKGKSISWYPDESWAGKVFGAGRVSFKLRKFAESDPPNYMAVDLRTGASQNVLWFSSAEAMPEPITNDVWKTDYLVMRRIPAKDVEWFMGIAQNADGTSVEGDGRDGGSPYHRVKLSQDYMIGVFELTQKQWQYLVGTAVTTGDTLPFTGATKTFRAYWGSTKAWPMGGYTEMDGGIKTIRTNFPTYKFDLPTEAQWEFACRAGTAAAYCNNNTAPGLHGNSAVNLNDYGWYKDNSGNRAHVGGEKLPNGFGLYDMHGNVSEYCLDAPDANCGLTDAQLASATPIVDPCGVWKGVSGGSFRMLRGGNFSSDYQICRSGFRYESMHPDAGATYYGARLVCPLPGATFPVPVDPSTVEQ